LRKQSLYERAIGYLARREHSATELKTKLLKAGFIEQEISELLVKLADANLQSDARFAESFLRYRANRGYGSQRIRQELTQRGVDSEIIADAFQQADVDWFALAVEVRCKRFGEDKPDDYKLRAKQQRFLQYRGFTHEQIIESFNDE